MGAKKTVKKFLSPNWVPLIISLLIPGVNFFGLLALFGTVLPRQLRANKSVKRLEAAGKLEEAAAELLSGDSKRFMNGKLVMSANYMICRKTGYMFAYDEVVWAYKHTQTYSVFFIPIVRIDSLYLAAKNMGPSQVVAMGKDKTDEIKNAIVEIYRHNTGCLVGYTDETRARYKALQKG